MKTLALLLSLLTAQAADWSFPAPAQSPSCHVQPGDFSSGWLSNGLGQANGFWDLGRAGTVTASVTSAVPSTVLTVSTVEWQDGGIFSEFCSVAVSGVQIGERVELLDPTPTFGAWIRRSTEWRLDSPNSVVQVKLTAPAKGALMDSLTVSLGEPMPTNGVRLWVEAAESPAGPWRAFYVEPVSNLSATAFFRLRIGQ